MNTVKIYRITRTKCYSMDEQGECFSLAPWGHNTEYYEGTDDGGCDYILPNEFRVSKTVDGEPAIFHRHEKYACDLMEHSSGQPQICTMSHGMPVLVPVISTSGHLSENLCQPLS